MKWKMKILSGCFLAISCSVLEADMFSYGYIWTTVIILNFIVMSIEISKAYALNCGILIMSQDKIWRNPILAL